MNNPFAMMGGMPGMAGLMGMGSGGMGGGLNSSQLSSMWGGMPGGARMGGMGYGRGMMDQVRHNRQGFVNQKHLKLITENYFSLVGYHHQVLLEGAGLIR